MFQNVRIILLSVCLLCMLASNAQPRNQALSEPPSASKPILPGAEQIDKYMPLLKGKKIAVFANHTSVVGKSHLVDTLQKLGVDIKVIFAPEHGFRGTADAGEKIGDAKDAKTGIPVISLYGTKRKPSAEDLEGVDIMVFDIQDVGVRFYTYISSLEEYIEAATEKKDR